MATKPGSRTGQKTRRTTLTLPEASLVRAERIARARHVNLSTVVAESMNEGLAAFDRANRSGQIVEAYRRAFAELSSDERALVDGIIVEEPRIPKPARKR